MTAKARTPESTHPLEVARDGLNVWSHVRQKWLLENPEERVRQEYLPVLVNEYGFDLDQIGEELEVTGRGSAKARADFVIWRSKKDRTDKKSPLIVVECKSDNVTISAADYEQGDNYARLCNAKFVVTHNSRETRYWRVLHEQMPKNLEEIENIPSADASDTEIKKLIEKLRIFKEDEFAKVLKKCHNTIRNREKLDPAAAFDEIAKILFVKVWVERELKSKHRSDNLFSVGFLDSQIGERPLDALFDQMKGAYEADEIFHKNAEINLKPATAREIVKELERYNLSDTSEDVKGIAFERFLGRTFRGEIGQFFTPRPIVEFMIKMIDPKEGETVCDPASGSGGFLIRFFELVREQILEDADRQYAEIRTDIEASKMSEKKKAEALREAYDQIQEQLRQGVEGSRMWTLANRSIYGVDANDRMARTSKMNMIMHGDGHGGVHHHEGFLNVNGIFEGRFDVVLTNPPFGQSVESSDLVEVEDLTPKQAEGYEELYGAEYVAARARVESAAGKPLASLFELPKSEESSIKTELLFLERCLALLKPGGRLAIVLPEGIFNNSSLDYVRQFVEKRAFITAVVSLPEGTFKSTKADVKASLLFLKKFNQDDEAAYGAAADEAREAVEEQMEQLADNSDIEKELSEAKTKKAKSALEKKLKERRRLQQEEIDGVYTQSLRSRFDYPIFMYEAEYVGITSTGSQDQNELLPNERVPEGIEKTCLELFREFEQDPTPFLLSLD